MLSWCRLLVVGRSKIWTLARAMYRLPFPDVVCRGGLALFALLPLLPGIGAWAGVCCKLVSSIWGLCCGLCGGLNGPIGSSLPGEGFELVSYSLGLPCLRAGCPCRAKRMPWLLDLRPRQFGPTAGSGFVQFVRWSNLKIWASKGLPMVSVGYQKPVVCLGYRYVLFCHGMTQYCGFIFFSCFV